MTYNPEKDWETLRGKMYDWEKSAAVNRLYAYVKNLENKVGQIVLEYTMKGENDGS